MLVFCVFMVNDSVTLSLLIHWCWTMDELPTKRKLNPESVSPEANQTKKHQVGLSHHALYNPFLVRSAPTVLKKECALESKASQCDLCGIWEHAECEEISSKLYNNFNYVVSSVNVLYYCEKLTTTKQD